MTPKSVDFEEELAKASRLLSQIQGEVLEAERRVRAIGDKAIEAEQHVRAVEVHIGDVEEWVWELRGRVVEEK